MKLELLDPRVLQVPLVRWVALDRWDLQACQERGGALDPAVQQANEVYLETSENQVQWVLWESMAPLDIQEPPE